MFTFDWSFWFLRFLCKTNFSLFSEILKSWIIRFWSWVCVNIWRRYSWGFFPMNSTAVRTFAVDTYFLSVWVCSVFVSFLVTVDVDWTVTAFDSFSADSLPWTEPVKVCAYFIKRNTKKSPNSLLYKTNQTTEQRSCYSKVDTVIKYNFLSCQCEISMKSCSNTACLYSQRGTVTGTCVRHQGTECALVCVIKDVLPV